MTSIIDNKILCQCCECWVPMYGATEITVKSENLTAGTWSARICKDCGQDGVWVQPLISIDSSATPTEQQDSSASKANASSS